MGSTASEMKPYDESTELNSEEARAKIVATRAEMSETVNAIQAKLSPQNVQETSEQIIKQAKEAALEVSDQAIERAKQALLDVKDQVKENIRDATIGSVERMANNISATGREASASLVEIVKANPIPAAMVGLGLAWLAMNRPSQTSQNRYENREDRWWDSNQSRYGSQARNSVASHLQQAVDTGHDKAAQVASDVSRKAEDIKEQASEWVENTQSQVGDMADRVQTQAQRVVAQSQSMLENNPLITGALAIAVGATVGLLIPATERENELMGEARDRFVSQASETARSGLDKAQKLAGTVIDASADKIESEQQKLDSSLQNKTQSNGNSQGKGQSGSGQSGQSVQPNQIRPGINQPNTKPNTPSSGASGQNSQASGQSAMTKGSNVSSSPEEEGSAKNSQI